MTRFILILLLFSACSTTDDPATLRREFLGEYELQRSAREFFIREQRDLIPNTFEDDQIAFDANTQLNFLANALSVPVWSFVEAKKKKAIFRLIDQNKYIGVTIDGIVLLVDTNTVSSPDKVLFEWMVPFATKQE
ncbi:MAG: hypothetical protein ACRCTJ_00510 [Brevinema sp.]